MKVSKIVYFFEEIARLSAENGVSWQVYADDECRMFYIRFFYKDCTWMLEISYEQVLDFEAPRSEAESILDQMFEKFKE